MSVVIMAYAGDIFKEYFLEAVNNTDQHVLLDRDLFALEKDIYLKLEVLNSQWSFVRSSDYSLRGSDGSDYFDKKIKNGDILTLRSKNRSKITLIITESANSFQIFRKYDISSLNEIRIGSQNTNHIQYSFLNYMSRSHAYMQYTGKGWVLQDTSVNGTFINAKKITSPYYLQFGDCVTLFGLRLMFLGNMLAVCDNFGTDQVTVRGLREFRQTAGQPDRRIPAGTNGQPDRRIPAATNGQPEKKYFRRAPRNMEALHEEMVEIEAPPELHVTKEKPLFMVIGPSFTMAIPMMLGSLMVIIAMSTGGRTASAYMFTGIITAVSAAIVGVIWALTNLRYEKQVKTEEAEQRFNAYGNYLIGVADRLKNYYEENRRALLDTYPPASQCLAYNENSVRLWNRNARHEDFLAVRLGTGAIPFQVDIQIPKPKFDMYADELKDKPLEIRNNYSMLYDVPVCLDLRKKRLVGIVGGDHMWGARKIVQAMVAQIATANCYTDVRLVFLYESKSDEDETFWEFARWLPHVFSADRKIRYVATNRNEISDVCYELAGILRQREEEVDLRGEEPVLPHYILFVENPKLLYGELLSKYALEPKEEYGLSTILMAERYEDLPNACEDIIENNGANAFITSLAAGGPFPDSNLAQIMFDEVDRTKLERFARDISSVEVSENVASGELPESIDFLKMHGVRTPEELHVEERWAKSRTYDNMKALIGVKSGGENCYLDIHEKAHGPHGLVAGTTGSGKSETLETWMLSLAVNFSPYDVSYFIIDFKGGGMANLFSELPHLAGRISNLSGNQVRRAMISIKSEIRRRQRLFTENNVNNINLYTRLYKSGETSVPIPHLCIIIDEFAELKREEPEFMKELISVAQVGRSLGVHLILATQKPGGTVDDNIWSNARFRLCLRVQDRQDSSDMLHKPDAAYITQAGCGYLQVGNDEIFEQFQSGYSGAVYDEEGTPDAIAVMLTSTGRAAVVGNRMNRRRQAARRRRWLGFLVRAMVKSAERMGAILELMVMSERFEELYEEIFREIAGAGYRCEDSPSTRIHMKEMAGLLVEAGLVGENSGLTRSDEEAGERLERLAEEKGIRLPEAKDKTQLEAVVDYLGETARNNHYEKSVALWLPVLPSRLILDEGYEPQTAWNLRVNVGMYDDPENQEQQPYEIDLGTNGHYAICGAVVTGKSTFLQTMVYAMIRKYTPQHVNFYLLDFSSHMLDCLACAPHAGGVVFDDQPDRLRMFMHMLERMMDERRVLLRGGNYRQYVSANGVKIPAVVIVLDGYTRFHEKTNDAYDQVLQRLAREGVGYGIYLAVGAGGFGTNGIPNRIGMNIRNVVALDLGDRFKFAEALRVPRVEILPEPDIKGRGLVSIGGKVLEFQTALAVDAEDDYARSDQIREICADMAARWSGAAARQIPEIPEKPVFAELTKTEGFRAVLEEGSRLPFAWLQDDASCYGTDLRTAYCCLISGKPRTGKTNCLKVLLQTAYLRGDAELCVIENEGEELKKMAESRGIRYAKTDEEIFAFFKDTVQVFKDRNSKKRRLAGEIDEAELFDAMADEKPYFIFIADLSAFVKGIYRKLGNGSSMSGYLENILERGQYHKFYFFACANSDDTAKNSSYRAYQLFTGYKQGIHLGGNTAAQRQFAFTNIPYAEQNRIAKPGIGLVPSEEDPSTARTIVIPLAKGL